MNTLCLKNKVIQIIYFDYIIPILYALAAITILFPLWLYINAYTKNKLGSSLLLYYIGLTFFCAVWFDYVNMAIQYSNRCHNQRLFSILHSASICIYVFQAGTIVMFLFIRLIEIFKDTSFYLSKWTIRWFIILEVFAVPFGIFGLLMRQYYTKLEFVGLLFWGLAALVYVITVLWLNYLFIYKLLEVYRGNSDKNNRSDKLLIATVTKTSLLCFISTSNVILFILTYILSFAWDSPHSIFIARVIICVDLYTNFLSVILSFGYFESWYFKSCGCCHRKCHSFWSNCVKKDPQVMLSHVMAAQDLQTTPKQTEITISTTPTTTATTTSTNSK